MGRTPIRKILAAACLGAIAAASAAALLSLALPPLISGNFDQRSLSLLKRQALEAEKSFAGILASFEARKEHFRGFSPSSGPETIFRRFKSAGLDPETEGIALADGDGNLELWLGRVLGLRDFVPSEDLKEFREEPASFLVDDKSSIFLVHLQPLAGNRYVLAHFTLLAFIPQFQSSYVLESHALGPLFKTGFDIDYWNYREDVSGFERLFSRHPDGYAGQPQRRNEIQTLFFPLRNESGRIIATVTLLSPSLTSKVTAVRESLYCIIGLLIAAAGVLAVALLWTSPRFIREKRFLPGFGILLLCVGLRLLFFPLGRLERVQSLSVFSPSAAGFVSLGGLTRSPADIFLTSLLVFVFSVSLAVYGKRLFQAKRRTTHPVLSLGGSVLAGGLAAAGLTALGGLVEKTVFNANFSLLRWSFDGPFVLLHLGLLLFTLSVLILLAQAFRLALLAAGNDSVSGALVIATAGTLILILGRPPSFLPAVLSLLVIAGLFLLARSPSWITRRETVFFGLLLVALFLARTIDTQSSRRTRVLLETTLRHTIVSQETWGNFLMEQSFTEFDRRQRDLVAYFKNPAAPDYAHSLWENSPVAKFNWYSSLEIRDGEGNVLSRFAMNVPKVYGTPPLLEPSTRWTVVRRALAFIGKEKEFLVGYKDWHEAEHYLGRVVLFVSLDPEILPFLYSANPYFEVLRTNPIPSLNHFDFGCAVYDLEGNPLFNPEKITSAVPPADIARLAAPGLPFWTRFRERGKDYDAYLFHDNDKIFRLFAARKELKTRAVAFLRIFLFYLGVVTAGLAGFALMAGRARLREPFRSFSNRVYAAFLASALVPLLLFTVFTRNLFDRIFTERFVEDAAIHASFARSLLEDFLIIQGMEVSPYLAPSEDLVLWISSTLSNDVNLYSDAFHLASSRREFFDSGLIPDLLDGEAYYNLVFGKKPYDTRRTLIGDYSFQTLTVPYPFKEATLFISLPFPFEKEETARATAEIVEFLVLLSSFFFLLIFLFSRGIRTMIIVPIRKLLAGTREVSLGNLEVAIEHRSRDEMMTLIEGFNTMIQDLKTREQDLAEMSKKVAWTEMARKVAHEIKNPLTPIQLSAEHTLKVFEDKRGDFEKTLRESMSYIIGEVQNLRRIARDFMEIARDTSLRRDPLDLEALITETVAPYRKLLAERILFRVVFEGKDLRTAGDEAKLKMAVRNVITNAVEAIEGEGEIAVTVSRDGDALTVSIRDNGPGMSRAVLERIFDPYFSTKDAGTGLGLAISKKIVEDHDGTIRVRSDLGKGTTVTIVIPLPG